VRKRTGRPDHLVTRLSVLYDFGVRARWLIVTAALGIAGEALIASGCGGGNEPDGVPGLDGGALGDAPVRVDGMIAPPPGPCPAAALTVPFTGLIAGVASAIRGPVGDGGLMTVPTDAERDAFAAQVLRALAFDGNGACPLPSSYRVAALTDHGDAIRVVAEIDETGAARPALFWGTYAARRSGSGTRDLVIEAPHPLADRATEGEGALIFSVARAEFYLVAGSHRCANPKTSSCDGATDACGSSKDEPYRESDAAHSTKTPFWAIHAAISAMGSSPFVQLHGNDSACPEALLADGSGTFSDAGLTARFADALEAQGTKVGRCGAGFPTSTCGLCATDNVEARATAGSSAACTMRGTAYGRFVHVEQLAALRGANTPVVNAVVATFPARP